MLVVRILNAITENPGGIRELSRKLNVPKSSVEKALKDLANINWTVQDPSVKNLLLVMVL